MPFEIKSTKVRKTPSLPTIAETLHLEVDSINEIEFKDVVISEDVVLSVSKVVATAIRKHIPASCVNDTLSELVGNFHDRAWWIAETNSLVLSMEILGEHHFFVIPKKQWSTRRVTWN